jgi:hypothetical protein
VGNSHKWCTQRVNRDSRKFALQTSRILLCSKNSCVILTMHLASSQYADNILQWRVQLSNIKLHQGSTVL